MHRVTKDDLVTKVAMLNRMLIVRGIDKVYEVNYRNGYTMLDRKGELHGTILGTVVAGTKTEVYNHLESIISALA